MQANQYWVKFIYGPFLIETTTTLLPISLVLDGKLGNIPTYESLATI